MILPIRVFGAWNDDAYRHPVQSVESPTQSWTQICGAQDQPDSADLLRLEWSTEGENRRAPDLTVFGLERGLICRKDTIDRLGLVDSELIELLPVSLESESWFTAIPKTIIQPLPEKLSYDSIPTESGGECIVWISWFNILIADAGSINAFKLSLHPHGRVYFTEPFVKRCHALGLVGVRFEHVGYIVDKPENAVPPPLRPAPQVNEAPRWPKWKPALEEEVAPFTKAGQAFLQARGLTEASEASAILSILAAEVEAHRPDYTQLKPKPRKVLLDGLAGAFGLLLLQQLRWNWVVLQVTTRAWDLGLESPNGGHALCLNQVMVRQLTAAHPSTIELLFNMIAEGNLPEGQAGDHLAIG